MNSTYVQEVCLRPDGSRYAWGNVGAALLIALGQAVADMEVVPGAEFAVYERSYEPAAPGSFLRDERWRVVATEGSREEALRYLTNADRVVIQRRVARLAA